MELCKWKIIWDFQGHLVRYHGFAASMEEREQLFQMLKGLKKVKKKVVNIVSWNNACIHLFVYDIQNSKTMETCVF